jgi:hypothetical protein
MIPARTRRRRALRARFASLRGGGTSTRGATIVPPRTATPRRPLYPGAAIRGDAARRRSTSTRETRQRLRTTCPARPRSERPHSRRAQCLVVAGVPTRPRRAVERVVPQRGSRADDRRGRASPDEEAEAEPAHRRPSSHAWWTDRSRPSYDPARCPLQTSEKFLQEIVSTVASSIELVEVLPAGRAAHVRRERRARELRVPPRGRPARHAGGVAPVRPSGREGRLRARRESRLVGGGACGAGVHP